MNGSLHQRAVRNGEVDLNHSVLAELTTRSWEQDRPYFTLNQGVRGAWLEASWWRPSGRSALESHWSRRAPYVASTDLPYIAQAEFGGGT